MSRTKEGYTVTGPSKEARRAAKPWRAAWWETTTDKQGTREIRKVRWFKKKAEALAHGQRMESQRLHSSIRQLTDSERAEYLHFITEAEARGLKTKDVFYAGLAHYGADKIRETPLAEAIEIMSIWMHSEDYSMKTIRGMEWSIQWVCQQTDGQRLVSSFTAGELVTLVRLRYTNHTSRESFLRNLKSFFSWCAGCGYCSPVIATDANLDEHKRRSSAEKSANRRTEKRPRRLTIDQIKTIFESTEARFHPVFALGIFAGLRPESECMRIEWSMHARGHLYGVDFEQRLINMSDKWVTKTRLERTITDLPDVFWQIMQRHRGTGRITPVTYSHFRRLAMAPAKKALGWDDWSKDITRHTAASFQYVLIGKELAMKNMGHKQAATFDRHYLNSVSRSEADALTELKL